MMQIINGDDDGGGGCGGGGGGGSGDGDVCVSQLKNALRLTVQFTHTRTHNPLTSKKESQSGSVL